MTGVDLVRASKLFVVLSLVIAFADKASASDNKSETSTTQPSSAESPVQAPSTKSVSVSSVLYLDALNFEHLAEAPRPVDITAAISSPVAFPFPTNATRGIPSPGGPQGISSIPLTPKGKFEFFATRSFKPPWPYVVSAFVGTIEELIDNNEGKDQDTGDFFADSGSRAARNFTARITANFFEKFAYAVAFKQDPRYHRSDKIRVSGKIGYALSRLFVTKGDNGNTQFNASYLLGAVTAAALSNVWETERNRGVTRSAKRLAIHLGFTAISNIVHEFRGGH